MYEVHVFHYLVVPFQYNQSLYYKLRLNITIVFIIDSFADYFVNQLSIKCLLNCKKCMVTSSKNSKIFKLLSCTTKKIFKF